MDEDAIEEDDAVLTDFRAPIEFYDGPAAGYGF